jgi:hypothetical protein
MSKYVASSIPNCFVDPASECVVACFRDLFTECLYAGGIWVPARHIKLAPVISCWCSRMTKGRTIPFSIHFWIMVRTWIVVRVRVIARVSPSWWSSATATTATSIVIATTRIWPAGMSPGCWSRGWERWMFTSILFVRHRFGWRVFALFFVLRTLVLGS